jgi:hypothetical protein
MQAKPWQIVVIALALVAAGASTAYMLSQSGPKFPTKITLMDVTTGQLFEWDTKKYRVSLPAADPASGEYRLVPVEKGEGGAWILTGNAKGMLRSITSKVTAVDTKTGEVTGASSDVKRYVPPGAKG